MQCCRTLLFDGPGLPLRRVDTPVPTPGPGEILVRNEYATLCRSDLHTYCGRRSEKTPTILGHEIVGRIAALGPDAPRLDCRSQPLAPGDRVTWAIYASEPDSPRALAGIPQKAPGLFKYGHERWSPGCGFHGGLGEYCLLRRNTPVAKVQGNAPVEVLALVNCAIATAAGAVRLAGAVESGTVLVGGAGMLGLATAALCKAAGAGRIIALDVSEDRLQVARQFGVDVPVLLRSGDPWPDGCLPDPATDGAVTAAIDCSGVPETMEQMARVLGIGGTLVLVGATFPQRPIQLEAEQVVRRLLTVRGLHNYNLDDFRAALEFIEGNHARFPFRDLIVGDFDLDTAEAAFDRATRSTAHRVGICTRAARTPPDC